MDRVVSALRAVGEPTRLRLLALCARGELTVGELTRIVLQSQPRVSRHLKLLCEAGLLERFREGTHAYYRLSGDGFCGRLARFLVDALPGEDETLALDMERLEDIRHARAEAAAAYFRKNAAQWDSVRSLYVDEGEVEEALLNHVPPGEVHDLLDVGTGTGRILELVAPRVERAVGIDLSRDMLAVARANLERADLRNCTVRHCDMYRLPWPAGSFDAVTIHQVLHFSPEPAGAIAEAARVLRPGGRMIVVDFAPHALGELQTKHAHRWLGFEDREVEDWYRAAGLVPGDARHLPGDPLTVCIWPAVRPPDARSARRPSPAGEEAVS